MLLQEFGRQVSKYADKFTKYFITSYTSIVLIPRLIDCLGYYEKTVVFSPQESRWPN